MQIPASPSPENRVTTSHIKLKTVPLPLRAIFNEYFQLGNRIRKHYLSPGVFLELASGRFVPPIHRKNLYSLQYSMLPKRRAGIWELWERLKDAGKVAAKTRMNGKEMFAVRRAVQHGLPDNLKGRRAYANGLSNAGGRGALGRVRRGELG